MITVVVEADKVNGDLIIVDKLSDINHVKNVFRKTLGDRIRAVDGKNEYLCQIEKIDNKEIILRILNINKDSFSYEMEIHAGICLLKNEKMDLTIQKLTELGIKKIIPIAAKRSVAKLDKKKEKWDIIMKEALKQCQGISPTYIENIIKLSDINYSLYDLIIVPYECEEQIYLKSILKSLKEKPKKILFIIGPEGGFDNEEIDFLRNRKANIISLGKRDRKSVV